MTQIDNNFNNFNIRNSAVYESSNNGSYYLLNEQIGDTLSLSTSNSNNQTLNQKINMLAQLLMLRMMVLMGMLDVLDDGQINGSSFQSSGLSNVPLFQNLMASGVKNGLVSGGGNTYGNRSSYSDTYTPSSSASDIPGSHKNYPEGTIKNIIVQEANQRGIPPAIALAMFEKESGFNTNAVGDGGSAVGLGQLHAAAAREGGISPSERKDPVKNIQASLNYLKQRYNETGDWKEALGAYNQGPGGIKGGVTRQRGISYANNVIDRASKYA